MSRGAYVCLLTGLYLLVSSFRTVSALDSGSLSCGRVGMRPFHNAYKVNGKICQRAEHHEGYLVNGLSAG